MLEIFHARVIARDQNVLIFKIEYLQNYLLNYCNTHMVGFLNIM